MGVERKLMEIGEDAKAKITEETEEMEQEKRRAVEVLGPQQRNLQLRQGVLCQESFLKEGDPLNQKILMPCSKEIRNLFQMVIANPKIIAMSARITMETAEETNQSQMEMEIEKMAMDQAINANQTIRDQSR